jgi:hypothetical protein
VGVAFERAIAGMSRQSGGNTQFGALLLLVPLVRAAAEVAGTSRAADARGALQRADAAAVVEATTVADAADFYRAFEHVDVAVADPPEGMDALDVRRGADAIPAVRERGSGRRASSGRSRPPRRSERTTGRFPIGSRGRSLLDSPRSRTRSSGSGTALRSPQMSDAVQPRRAGIPKRSLLSMATYARPGSIPGRRPIW